MKKRSAFPTVTLPERDLLLLFYLPRHETAGVDGLLASSLPQPLIFNLAEVRVS